MDPATALNDLNRPQPSTTDQSQTPKQPYRRARHPYQEAASPSCHCALSEKAPRRAGIEEKTPPSTAGSLRRSTPIPHDLRCRFASHTTARATARCEVPVSTRKTENSNQGTCKKNERATTSHGQKVGRFLKFHKMALPPNRFYRFDFVAVSSIYRTEAEALRYMLETATKSKR